MAGKKWYERYPKGSFFRDLGEIGFFPFAGYDALWKVHPVLVTPGEIGFFPFAGYDGDMFRSRKHKGKYLSVYSHVIEWRKYTGRRDSWTGRPYYEVLKRWGERGAYNMPKAEIERMRKQVIDYLKELK